MTRRQLKCLACDGVYFDQDEIGVAYFHACPPIIVTPAKGDPTLPGFVPAVFGPRPNARNENLAPVPPPDVENPKPPPAPAIISEGAGVSVVAVVA